MTVRLRSLTCTALSVALREPFVIASGQIDTTRAALVRAELEDPIRGRLAHGLGEAAALPPVTREDQPELLAAIEAAAPVLVGASFSDLAALTAALDRSFGSKVARAGVECALLDAWAKLADRPLSSFLGGHAPCSLRTDITLPIAEPAHMAELAAGYRTQGFDIYKVKVGRDLDQDIRALAAVHARVPDAHFRLDANAGFDVGQALALLAAARRNGLAIDCFEQPCAARDLASMAMVTSEAGVPVIADESVQGLDDLARIVEARAAHGVNLKLAKTGGLLAAFALGTAARAHGLAIMCGGMVETRLGMSAMAHVACALGGVEYVDLDTAFLLDEERFAGGYRAHGALLELTGGAGLDVRLRTE